MKRFRPGQKVEAKRSYPNLGLYAYDEYVVEYVRDDGSVLLEGLDYFVRAEDLGEIPDARDDHWRLQQAHEKLAQELATARRDLDLWANRCEAAENLLRGFLEGRAEVPDRAREHLKAVGS